MSYLSPYGITDALKSAAKLTISSESTLETPKSNSPFKHTRLGFIRIYLGTSIKEVFCDILRVDHQDALVEQPSIDDVTWRT
jgi:hypothetical protein